MEIINTRVNANLISKHLLANSRILVSAVKFCR
jgi:hypothetical protein